MLGLPSHAENGAAILVSRTSTTCRSFLRFRPLVQKTYFWWDHRLLVNISRAELKFRAQLPRGEHFYL
ncbi:Hypothetical predicted protein [Podarcis lilfordi]|uniref:Uncharacterized protein n=1 Tax=Podarcis lilfordi TaxID=74358 RepID=A0AA35PDR6_9SAUR|nr:Hypothetical predicted protein [Podarcis lilfordi]